MSIYVCPADPNNTLTNISSFCRKTTMVKHQRRSHRSGIHSSELDDGETSESESGDSPSTPGQSGLMQWPQSVPSSSLHPTDEQGHVLQRSHSYGGFDHHQLSSQPFNNSEGHRHSLSSEPRKSHYLAPPMHEQYTSQATQQSTADVPQHSYYVPAQAQHPTVVSMNATHARYQVPSQAPERPRISYGQHGLTPSASSSPGGYSTASTRSPAPPEIYYTHHPMQQQHQYPMHNTPQVEHQQQPMVQYTHQSIPPVPQQGHPATMVGVAIPQAQPQFQQPPQEQWYAAQPYQEPVEVMSAIPYHNGAVYDPWHVKVEPYDDPSIQMPSTRIETLQ